MRLIECDVVVVGAGPAGSLAARTAAEGGVRVVLLEEHPVVGSPVSCAEGLSLGGISNAGVEPVKPLVSQRVLKAKIYAPNMNCVELTSDNWSGYNLNRNHFDRALGDNAVKAGAELMTRTSARGVVKEGGKVVGVRAEQDGSPVEIRAKITIGADGYASVVRRSAGLTRFFQDYCSCAQYTLGGLRLSEPGVNEFYLSVEKAPGGYVWIFPKSGETANVGVGVRKINREPAAEYLKRFIREDERFQGAKILSSCGGITPVSGLFEKITDDGLMLVGDAAGQVVPMTGAGIHCGLEGGKMAAAEAVKAIGEGDVSGERLSRYHREFEKYWGKRIRNSRRVVEMLDRFGEEELNMLGSVIESDEVLALANGQGTKRALAKIIARSPGKIVKLMAAYLK